SFQGDSGGGLAVLGSTGQWSLLGVLSHGTDCEELRQGYPPKSQVYTDISLYAMDIDIFTGYDHRPCQSRSDLTQWDCLVGRFVEGGDVVCESVGGGT
ncbi:unnamed protein product, partial [Onchocerca flexuosa]|uniref:Peptidase S1 domain-containing protein n=1 Tax=Onchocerca flexuosa TaxID=387005 RepID=A0A183I7U7_9BILA